MATVPMHAPPAQGDRGDSVGAGRLYAMACEQIGSKQLQKALATYSPARLQAAVDELAPHLAELATHRFGNYLVSSMCSFEVAHPPLAAALAGKVIALIQHAQGSRVVQAALEALPAHEVASLVDELRGHVAAVGANTHGSWGVVAAYNHTHAPFLLEEAMRDLPHLAAHIHGSRVIQRILPEAASHGVDLSGALAALTSMGEQSLSQLACDQYGNYVVQHGLRLAPIGSTLVDLLLPSLRAMALTKCGSNVAEVLISRCSNKQIEDASLRLEDSDGLIASHCFGKHVMHALSRKVAEEGA